MINLITKNVIGVKVKVVIITYIMCQLVTTVYVWIRIIQAYHHQVVLLLERICTYYFIWTKHYFRNNPWDTLSLLSSKTPLSDICDCNIYGTATCQMDTGECTCHTGFTGDKCDTCADGYEEDGTDCSKYIVYT